MKERENVPYHPNGFLVYEEKRNKIPSNKEMITLIIGLIKNVKQTIGSGIVELIIEEWKTKKEFHLIADQRGFLRFVEDYIVGDKEGRIYFNQYLGFETNSEGTGCKSIIPSEHIESFLAAKDIDDLDLEYFDENNGLVVDLSDICSELPKEYFEDKDFGVCDYCGEIREGIHILHEGFDETNTIYTHDKCDGDWVCPDCLSDADITRNQIFIVDDGKIYEINWNEVYWENAGETTFDDIEKGWAEREGVPEKYYDIINRQQTIRSHIVNKYQLKYFADRPLGYDSTEEPLGYDDYREWLISCAEAKKDVILYDLYYAGLGRNLVAFERGEDKYYKKGSVPFIRDSVWERVGDTYPSGVEDAAYRWLRESFNEEEFDTDEYYDYEFIDGNTWFDDDDAPEGAEIFSNTLWRPRDSWLEAKIRENAKEISDLCGLYVLKRYDTIFIVPTGMGYSWISAHWVPLYSYLGVKRH